MARELRGKELLAWLRERRKPDLEERARRQEEWLDADESGMRRNLNELHVQNWLLRRSVERLWTVISILCGFAIAQLLVILEKSGIDLLDIAWDFLVTIVGIMVGIVTHVVTLL